MVQRLRLAQTVRQRRTPCMPTGLRENIDRMNFFDFSCSVAVAPVYIPACCMTDTPMGSRPANRDEPTLRPREDMKNRLVKPGSFLWL